MFLKQMSAGRMIRWRSLAALTGLAVVAGLAVAVAPVRTPVAHASVDGQGSDFVPLPAVRIVDTRNGNGGVTGALGQGDTAAFPVTGRGGVPVSGVTSVLVDVATVSPSANTFLVLWADGTSKPSGSMLNALKGQTISNWVVVPVGVDGMIDVYNNAGSTQIAIDVHGYFTTGSGSGQGGFVPVTATRMVDTRSGLGAPQAMINPGKTLTVTLASNSPVPRSANAVWLNVAVPQAQSGGSLAVFPTGSPSDMSALDFVAGSTNTASVVKLGSDGRVTILNGAPFAINVVIGVAGYFTGTPTSGTGYRSVLARLYDTRSHGTGVKLGPNQTITVPVGGTNSLPVNGVSGAVLDVSAVDPEASGVLHVWPTGEPEPATSSTNFPMISNHGRSALAVVRPGRLGEITIRNVSSAPTHVVVDLQGWFGDPNLPVDGFSPTAAVQLPPVAGASVGLVDYVYTDNIGRLVYGHQTDAGDVQSVHWTVLPSDEEAFTGKPGLAVQANGLLSMVAHTVHSSVWASGESENTPEPVWGPWTNQNGVMASHVTLVRQSDGTLVAFAVDAEGGLWYLPQTAANGPYSFWRYLGDADLAASAPAAVAVGSGIQIFALDTTGTAKTAVFNGGNLSAWTELGGSGLTGTPAVVVYPGPRLRVFVRTADGSIQTKIQDVSGTWPAAWDTISGFTAAGSPAAILDPASGKTEVVARGTDSAIYHAEETVQGSGTWGIWTKESETDGLAETDPTVFPFTNANGTAWALVIRDIKNTTRVVPEQPGINPTAITLPAPPA